MSNRNVKLYKANREEDEVAKFTPNYKQMGIEPQKFEDKSKEDLTRANKTKPNYKVVAVDTKENILAVKKEEQEYFSVDLDDNGFLVEDGDNQDQFVESEFQNELTLDSKKEFVKKTPDNEIENISFFQDFCKKNSDKSKDFKVLNKVFELVKDSQKRLLQSNNDFFVYYEGDMVFTGTSDSVIEFLSDKSDLQSFKVLKTVSLKTKISLE